MLLNYILKYFIDSKISTQTHILHGAGQVWYKDVILDKKIYFDIPDSHVIGATVFIISMIDAAFNLPDEHENKAQNIRLSNTPKSPQKP